MNNRPLNIIEKNLPTRWEREGYNNPQTPLEEVFLRVIFSGWVGISGYSRVGIYSNKTSLNRDSKHFTCTHPCPSCGGTDVISASGVFEGVCLACKLVISGGVSATSRAEQCYWACEEAGIIRAWENKFISKSTAYFVV